MGDSKNAKGGIESAKHGHVLVPIHDASFFEGKLNLYQLIETFLSVRDCANVSLQGFSWA